MIKNFTIGLQLLFIYLKLRDLINLNWLEVTLPIIIYFIASVIWNIYWWNDIPAHQRNLYRKLGTGFMWL